MKKILSVLIAGLLVAASASSLDLELWGEVKTGFYAEWKELGGVTSNYARMHNNESDSGPNEGRLRMGLGLQAGNFGLRTRFSQTIFERETGMSGANDRISTDFAYAYLDVFNSQFRISAGLLGESPWGSGGPELFCEVENKNGGLPLMGIRLEWKPNFFPEWLGSMNLGFAINADDDFIPPYVVQGFGDLFLDSVIGIAWEHEYFAFRFAYRFDRGLEIPAAGVDGDRFVYRIEERILDKLVPGLSVSANGYAFCLNTSSDGRVDPGFIQHWLYILYDHEYLYAGLDIGYNDGFALNAHLLEPRLYIYGKLFNDMLRVGARGGMQFGFNNAKPFEDAPYNAWYFEPQIRVNFNNNIYAAAVYRYTADAQISRETKDLVTQWFNLRLCYSF